MELNEENDTISEGIGFLAIYDLDSSFTLQGDTISGVPVSCNGGYSLQGSDKIEFTNKAPVGALDDPYYILDTIFNYSYADTSFQLFLETETRSYRYSLERY